MFPPGCQPKPYNPDRSRHRCQPPSLADTCSQPLPSFRMACPPTHATPVRLASGLPSAGSRTASSDGPGLPVRRASACSVSASTRSQNRLKPGCRCFGHRYCSQLNGVVLLAIELWTGLGAAGIGFAFGPLAVWICAPTGVLTSNAKRNRLLRISMSTPLVPGS